MSIGSELVFPNGRDSEYGCHPGMTYRQWLIGQALAGLCALPSDGGDGVLWDLAAKWSIKTADLVIAALDAEATQPGAETASQ